MTEHKLTRKRTLSLDKKKDESPKKTVQEPIDLLSGNDDLLTGGNENNDDGFDNFQQAEVVEPKKINFDGFKKGNQQTPNQKPSEFDIFGSNQQQNQNQIQTQNQPPAQPTTSTPLPTPTITMDASKLSSPLDETTNVLEELGSDADADADADMEDDDSYMDMSDVSQQRAPEAHMANNNGTSSANFRLSNGPQRGSLSSGMEGLENQVVQGYVRIGA